MLTCPDCGYENIGAGGCPLCSGQWELWDLQLSPLPQPELRARVAAWLGQLPAPAAIELAAGPQGLKVRLLAAPGRADGAVRAWAALMQQQSRWEKIRSSELGLRNDAAAPNSQLLTPNPQLKTFVLRSSAKLPSLILADGDPFLALGGALLALGQPSAIGTSGAPVSAGNLALDPGAPGTHVPDTGAPVTELTASFRMWLLGHESALQERIRALAAYSYGTEGGVENGAPNPWAWRLALLRALLALSLMIAGLCGGMLGAGWLPVPAALIGILSGGLLFLVACLGVLDWLAWRSIPKEVLEKRAAEPLLRMAFSLQADRPPEIHLLAGRSSWQPLTSRREWPGVKAGALPLPASEVAALCTPPEAGEGSGLLDREAQQDVPAPPPSAALLAAPFKIGVAVAGGAPVGIDPDAHGLAVGGSRSGKSSFVFAVLKQLLERGPEAPGLFLVDPHLSLADAFLQAVDDLPPNLRREGIRRLRVISPDQPEVVPLNLLTVPDFTWAGNAIVQIGRRIWEDYWGPRMQAALLGLFRLAHAWNAHHPGERMGLLHVVFAAFNSTWRHETLAYLPPVERMGALALDALLGQLSQNYSSWGQGWATEVVSPVLSKAMALELSPWLFAAMHQDRFVDLESWVRERAWIVLRLPSGELGREGARLLAGVVYNVFEAAFRRATATGPIPYTFVVDEAQEIGAGMKLEALLSEGAKFGARLFVLAQSLTLLRKMEGFEPVVQALLANTSTQAFFSPDPEDSELIRAALNLEARYGVSTLDLPSLQAWLRARLNGRWQPPTQVRVQPLPRADRARVQALIREVIAAHSQDYASPDGWQEQAVRALQRLVPGAYQGLLGELLGPNRTPAVGNTAAAPTDNRSRGLGL